MCPDTNHTRLIQQPEAQCLVVCRKSCKFYHYVADNVISVELGTQRMVFHKKRASPYIICRDNFVYIICMCAL